MIDEFLDEVSRYADQFDYLASAKIALSLSDTATNVEVCSPSEAKSQTPRGCSTRCRTR